MFYIHSFYFFLVLFSKRNEYIFEIEILLFLFIKFDFHNDRLSNF